MSWHTESSLGGSSARITQGEWRARFDAGTELNHYLERSLHSEIPRNFVDVGNKLGRRRVLVCGFVPNMGWNPEILRCAKRFLPSVVWSC